jgi:hypothetical protein
MLGTVTDIDILECLIRSIEKIEEGRGELIHDCLYIDYHMMINAMADETDADVVNLGGEQQDWLHSVRRQNPEQYPNVDIQALYGTPENPKTPSQEELDEVLDRGSDSDSDSDSE